MKKPLLTVMLALSLCIIYTDALAVMSIDLGSEFMKVAIVKPGVPMEIVTNKESRRKTAVVVSFRNGERLFSDPALSTYVRFPESAYTYFVDLLGKQVDNPIVELYQKRFPYHTIEADPDTNTVVFRHDEETTFTPEELLAMVLQHARQNAEAFAEQTVMDAVITVPVYFNQAERRAVARAVELSGLKLLQLMSDNTAVALQFGIFRRKEFSNVTQHYFIFDMGASSTTASVVAYQEVKQKNAISGTVEKFPQLTVKGVGFDRTLGGLEFQLRLRDHLARKFNEQKKTAVDVFTNKRSMAKLLKEAGRVKNVLSANSDHYAQVESLLDDQDFKVKVTREEFEEMCSDLFDRIGKVVRDALTSSEVTMGEISEVLLMGAGTRIPKVQDHLIEATGQTELGKSLNTDEAAAIGAVYQAAFLSKGFKVKKFAVRDCTLYPIQVEFERVKTDENGEDTTKTVKRTLFGRNNPYPQKKVMTFNKQNKDFSFIVNYGELEKVLTDDEMKIFGSPLISNVALAGVGAAFSAHASTTEPKGIKAHFRVDESGILDCDKVEALFEKAPEEAAQSEDESTLSKLGNTISNFFGGGSEDDGDRVEDGKSTDENTEAKESKPDAEQKEASEKEPEAEKKKEEKETTEEETKSKDSEEKKESEQQESEKADKKKEEKNDDKKEESSDKSDGKKSDTSDKKSDAKDGKKEEKEKKPVKPATIRAEIEATVEIKDMKEPDTAAYVVSKKKIRELRKKDEEKAKLEQVMNDLESFLLNTQDKLYQEPYELCSSDTERETLRAAMTDASDWLYEVEEGTPRKDYEDKLTALQKLVQPLFERVKEFGERPMAIEALNSMVNYSEYFLVSMKNFTGPERGEQPFTQVEYDTLFKLVEETITWNKTMQEEQANTPLTEKPKFLIEDVGRKISSLDREVKYLVNKAKNFRPKVKKAESKNATAADNTTKPTVNDTLDAPPTSDGSNDEGVQMEMPPHPEDKQETKKDKKTDEEAEPTETLELESEASKENDKKVEEKEAEKPEDSDVKEQEKEAEKPEDSDKPKDSSEIPHDGSEL